MRFSVPNPGWQELYDSALTETDSSKIPEQVEIARRAIHERLIESGASVSREERDAMEEALRALFRIVQQNAVPRITLVTARRAR